MFVFVCLGLILRDTSNINKSLLLPELDLKIRFLSKFVSLFQNTIYPRFLNYSDEKEMKKRQYKTEHVLNLFI